MPEQGEVSSPLDKRSAAIIKSQSAAFSAISTFSRVNPIASSCCCWRCLWVCRSCCCGVKGRRARRDGNPARSVRDINRHQDFGPDFGKKKKWWNGENNATRCAFEGYVFACHRATVQTLLVPRSLVKGSSLQKNIVQFLFSLRLSGDYTPKSTPACVRAFAVQDRLNVRVDVLPFVSHQKLARSFGIGRPRIIDRAPNIVCLDRLVRPSAKSASL